MLRAAIAHTVIGPASASHRRDGQQSGENLSNEYQLIDGSPRYGSRTTEPETERPAIKVRVEEPAEAAARLGLDHMAAAIDRRLTSSWADRPNPLVTAMRQAHPEELAAAKAIVTKHLGSQRQWRMKAQAVRDGHLAATMRRRRAAGSAREILALRLVLLISLIALPAYIVATDREDLVKLLLVGVVCVGVAMAGGHFITVHARVPVMPNIRSGWLYELRVDIVNATLVGLLQSKGVELEARTVAAGQQGWKSIQGARAAVDALQS